MSTGERQVMTEAELDAARRAAARVRALDDRPRTYFVVTYGCQMNERDSETIAGMLEEMGLSPAADRKDAELILFNTCCVRGTAEGRALGNILWLKEVKKKRPDVVVCVCGCMVQQPAMAEKVLRQFKFVDVAFGTHNLWRFPELLLLRLLERRPVVSVCADERLIAEGLPVVRKSPHHAFLTVMYGCDNFCSYCVVPYVRGRERSRDMDAILREAEGLVADGVKEITLLGQNVNSYGRGLAGEPTFAALLRKLDAMGVPRIRFMTSHPKDLSDELIAAMADCPHVMKQLHLPVQSGNDAILAAMNRRYTRADYLARVAALRAAMPDIGLTTDLITAFPGETESQFQDTLSLVDAVGYDAAFTFIYSPRAGTKAAEMPDRVPAEVASERIARLIARVEASQARAFQRLIGSNQRVLVEGLSRRDGARVSGKCERGITVTFAGTASDAGQIVPVRVTEAASNTLRGERLQADSPI